jgi:hypothetical protein
MHTKRKITNLSGKHSFTPYPSLSPYSPTDGMADREINTLAAHGLEDLFSSCAVVSIFQFWREMFFGVTSVLRVQYSCGIVLVFWFKWEIVFGVTYVLRVQYSYVVVLVFWLWREIFLKMRTPFDFL